MGFWFIFIRKSNGNTCNLGFRLWSFIVHPYYSQHVRFGNKQNRVATAFLGIHPRCTPPFKGGVLKGPTKAQQVG